MGSPRCRGLKNQDYKWEGIEGHETFQPEGLHLEGIQGLLKVCVCVKWIEIDYAY